ncbi:MAG: hypothetical protein HKO65_10290 [Gemmatimonadetes bacterium]|nr:hypothetical protein [Gemmatimonadota bacterium]NNM05481.1 hypothetical protein [Gemmatimonadota bacterium]
MKPKLKTGLIAAVPVAVFMGIGMALANTLGLQGWVYRLFWMGFAALGAILGIAVFWFMQRMRSGKEVPVTAPQVEELEVRLGELKKRLAAAKRPGLEKLPVVVILGPPGSAKSSSVLGSDISAEHLVGDQRRGEDFPPTGSVNAWYADGTVLVEAGGGLTQDPSLWTTLVKKILPKRLLAAILAGKSQAPRAAVVCLSCQDLVGGAGNADNILAWAHSLRSQLLEMSEKLGVRVPVYVVFTKADTIPSFEDYFWNLTDEESRRVLGATLPLKASGAAASYVDTQSRVLSAAFGDLYRSLALKRLKYLNQGTVGDRASRAFEFPREFRKLTALASQFMVELCKPSQLQVSPFLRGFFFSGRREFVVEGVGGAPAPKAPEMTPMGGATTVFDPRTLAAEAVPPVSDMPSQPTRKLRWFFLSRVFGDVVLQDDIAIGMMRGGRRISYGRRLLLGVATFFILFILTPLLFSAFVQNRALQSRAEEALMGLRDSRSPDSSPASVSETLMGLEGLRDDADSLGTYFRDGPPLRFGGWLGLYVGPRLLPVVLDEYSTRFLPLLLSPAMDSVVTDLRGLPTLPNQDSDYQETYDLLRTYLITTRNPDKTDPDLLARVLGGHWTLSGGAVDDSLAHLQFEFFGKHLVSSDRFTNPPADEAVIVRTRDFLSRMGAVQPFYTSLINKANQRHEGFRVDDRMFGSLSPALITRVEVPGAFSLDGRAYVKDQLSRPDSLLQAEEWVLGPVSLPDPESVALGIDSLYEMEYRSQWRTILSQAYVPAFQGPGDAATKLGDLAGDNSPLTQLLSVASNAVFEGGEVATEEFLPLSAILPRDSTGRMGLSGTAVAYFDALDQLRSAMEEMDQAQGTETLSRAEGIGLREIPEAEGAVRMIRREMGTEPAGREVAAHLATLLSAPIDRAATLVRGVEPTEINRQGAEFCSEFTRRVGSKYPFQSSATEEPDMDDLAAVFQRGVSLVWNLGSALDSYIERSGPVYRQRAGSSVPISSSFLGFYGQARRFSESIFAEGAQTPVVEFSVRPSLSESSGGIESITLQVDGRQSVCTELDCRTLVMRWDGNSSSEVNLAARVDGQNVRIAGPFRGPWAVFHLFGGASGWRSPGEPHIIRWQVGGTQRTVAAVVDLGRLPPVFSSTLLRDMQCVPRIAGSR